jgi:hypothetical protein
MADEATKPKGPRRESTRQTIAIRIAATVTSPEKFAEALDEAGNRAGWLDDFAAEAEAAKEVLDEARAAHRAAAEFVSAIDGENGEGSLSQTALLAIRGVLAGRTK